RDGHFLILTVQHGWSATDVYLRDLRKRTQDWTPLCVGKNAIFNVYAWKDRLYVHHNDGAPNWRLDVVEPGHLERDRWRTLVPEAKDQTLEGFGIIGGRLALNYLKDVASRLEIRELDGKLLREVRLPGLGTVSGPIGLEEDDEAYFSFTSYTYPREI